MKRREFKPILNWIGVVFTIMAVKVGSGEKMTCFCYSVKSS